MGDYLDITFEYPVRTPDVSTQSQLLDLIVFDPPLENVTYHGEWQTWYVLRVYFDSITVQPPLYPNLHDFKQAVGELQVAVNPAARLLARDHSSPVALTNFVLTTGTWGDIPQDLVLSLKEATQFNVHWVQPDTTSGYTVPRYRCQVSTDASFNVIFRQQDFLPNETVSFDKGLVPFAYDEEFLWEVPGTVKGRTYCTRCAAFNVRSFGPWRASLPSCMVVDQPAIVSIDRFTTDLTTRGGPVNIALRNMGFGRHVVSLPVDMSYSNGINDYNALGCQMLWNGSTVTCIADEGVGRGHRWTMQLFGFAGFESPPSAITNYKPPVVYDILSEFNNTLTAPSAGNEDLLIIGNNFCCTDEDIFWVRYAPLGHPDVVFEAQCTIHTRHEILRCVTGPQAGSNLRWSTNIAGQESGPVFVNTRSPQITSVTVYAPGEGLRTGPGGGVEGMLPIRDTTIPLLANATLGLATSGGGIVKLRGT